MTFYFSSLHDFWWMDGHGPYVWASYAVTLVVFIALAAAPIRRKAMFVKQQRALLSRQSLQSEV
ncbi:MAG: heme exporter protein CcmD [Marinagarivorans sp.]|nr:heme exporter protein CcmD [Marinagarivorans sp.]